VCEKPLASGGLWKDTRLNIRSVQRQRDLQSLSQTETWISAQIVDFGDTKALDGSLLSGTVANLKVATGDLTKLTHPWVHSHSLWKLVCKLRPKRHRREGAVASGQECGASISLPTSQCGNTDYIVLCDPQVFKVHRQCSKRSKLAQISLISWIHAYILNETL